MVSETKKIRLFYSYSHKDEDLREKLETHLTNLKHKGLIDDWHDRKINAGNLWASQISKELENADIILFLVSPDFLASKYCYDIEAKRAIALHSEGKSIVIPIILRECDWEGSPFDKFQGLPRDMKPIISSHWHNVDEALKDVVLGLKRTIKGIRSRKSDRNDAHQDVLIPSRGRIVPLSWFHPRTFATSDMYGEMSRYRHLVFLGISHVDLVEHFRTVLEMSSYSKSVPWETIDIYYAKEEVGRKFQPDNFNEKAMISRHDIAYLLTSVEWFRQLSLLTRVSFSVCQHALITYGGSMLGSTLGEDMTPDFEIAYIVNYLPMQEIDAQKALTFKIDTHVDDSDSMKCLMSHYREAFKAIAATSKSIASFGQPTLWDLSVDRWADYSRSCAAHRESMRLLVRLAGLQGQEHVLEIGSGSGETTAILLNAIRRGALTAVESSPQMLRRLRKTIESGYNSRVEFVLTGVPDMNNLTPFDIDGKKYDLIVIHHALTGLVNSAIEVEQLAMWCIDYLNHQGRVMICVHNGAVDLDEICTFKSEGDVLRELMRIEADKHGYKVRRPASRLRPAQVINAFESHGFSLIKQPNNIDGLASWSVGGTTHSIPVLHQTMTWKDRRSLWRVPAVIGSYVDIEGLASRQSYRLVYDFIDNCIHTADKHVSGFPDVERTVAYFHFQLNVR
ncbi:MAG: TIR domain-containing protein [Geobacteraceae bacterium]